MIVFKYFYEKMDVFGPLISKKHEDDSKDIGEHYLEGYDEENEDAHLVHMILYSFGVTGNIVYVHSFLEL